MISVLTGLADAMVSEMNNAPPGTFTLPFTAVRGYKPVFDLPDLLTLRVTVVPRSQASVYVSRSHVRTDYIIEIGVQQKVDADFEDDCDDLMALVEQIGSFFYLRKLTSLPTATWIGVERPEGLHTEHLEQLHTFTSVLRLTYRIVIAVPS